MAKPYVGFSSTPGTTSGTNWLKKCFETGATVVRSTEGYTMKAYGEIGASVGIKVTWLMNEGEGFTSGNAKKSIEEWTALTAEQKAVFVLFECCNEPYEPTNLVPGKKYGEDFIKVAEEWKAKSMTIPLGMYARVSQNTGESSETGKWMTALGENKRTGSNSLESALIGNGSKSAPQHVLISHPYGGKPLTKLKNVNSLSTTNASEASEDAEGDKQGAQRWIHEQAIVANWTGITNLTTAITEFGAPSPPATEAVKNAYVKEIFEMAHKAWKGELTANAPAGYGSPLLYTVQWFDTQESGEGFGIFEENNPFNGIEPYHKTFKEAMATFEGEEEGKAPKVTNPGEQHSTVGKTISTLNITAEKATELKVEPLPAGLSLSGTAEAGKITGTPTTAESVTVKIKAKNAIGETKAEFTWHVATTVLLIGEEGILSNEDNIVGNMVATQFTAADTGTVNEMFFRTGAGTNTATELKLGIFAEGSSLPGALLGQGTYSIEPPKANTWISVSGLSIAVTKGTKYWLAFLPVGGELWYLYAANEKGTVIKASTKTYTTLTTTSEWSSAFEVGPDSIYGIESEVEFHPKFTAKFVSTAELKAKFSTSRSFKPVFTSTATLKAAVSTPHHSFKANLSGRAELNCVIKAKSVRPEPPKPPELSGKFAERLTEHMEPYDN